MIHIDMVLSIYILCSLSLTLSLILIFLQLLIEKVKALVDVVVLLAISSRRAHLAVVVEQTGSIACRAAYLHLCHVLAGRRLVVGSTRRVAELERLIVGRHFHEVG